MKNTPFIITIESYGVKYSVEFPSSDITLPKAIAQVVNVLVSAGYSEKSIAEYFKDGSPLGWEGIYD